MLLTLDWPQIALRLALSVVAGFILGFDRSEHGHPAGMRTTLLVCLAAAIAMIQANLLMPTNGKTPDSFVVLDLMRLPLGILSGMGFIGAGAILRKDNLVIGVTTAATLWFTTVMGLCFGGGQLGLGIAALILAWITLSLLKYVEKKLRQDVRADLLLALTDEGPSESHIRILILQNKCRILSAGLTTEDHGQRRQLRFEIQWRCAPSAAETPPFITQLAQLPGVEKLTWQSQGFQ